DIFDEEELRLLEEVAGDISFALDYLAKEARISYLAYYDALTSLPNRSLVMDRLRQGIALAQRRQRSMAVIHLDIDRFQVINDGLGHHVGDRLLRVVGERLAGCLRDGDTAGRLGGDEFAIVCCDLAGGEELTQVIEQVQAALLPAITLDEGKSFHITASLGVSVHPADGDDPAALLKYAGLAMTHAKALGRNNVQRFVPELDLKVAERLQVESRLVEALDRDELVLFYQPQFNAQSGAIDGMEALIRWQHPELGLLAPGQFIPVAEESGLIERIGEWVMQKACEQNKAWVDEGLSDFPISVNLSMAQFREHSLLDTIVRILAETGLDPRYLELELTESLIMSNAETFISFMHDVKARGVLVAIDDFGTGYSSLNYLKDLPLDRLKVDYTFVRDITVDPSSASICRAVIAIAHNLRLGVVAEGVESDAQAAYLGHHNCDSLQGFHLCRPAPAEEITALLRRRESGV
ncbi:MAG: EAL domain-containing protein, partial [Zoogloea sp.]|nr:EAL domain-containing protein [Zoogloea sp.]